MSVLDFPTSPTNGQYYNGFVWNAANETWDSAFAPRAATIPISSPNYIINGAFDINQRNFTSTTALNAFGFDRWADGFQGGTVTYSAQTFAPGTAPASAVEGKNYARLTTASQSASGDYAVLIQKIEDVRTLAGQPITISLWARAASGTPKMAVELFQGFGTGGSPSGPTFAFAGDFTLSTSWARYSVTVNVPSVVGKTVGTNGDSSLGIQFWTSGGSNYASRGINIGIQNTTVDFWGVQVEAGPVATEFRRNAPSIQGELAACQRYYYRTPAGLLARVANGNNGNSLTSGVATFYLPVTMRANAGLENWSNVFYSDNDSFDVNITSLSSNPSLYRNPATAFLQFGWSGNNGSAFRPGSLGLLSNGFIAFSAEL